MELKVVTIDPTEDDRWDDFVFIHPEATIYHHSFWAKVIHSTYGHEIVYLALEDEKKSIKGIAPFVFIKSRLTGNRMVSLPFAAYCNPILPAGALEKVLNFISDKYKDLEYIEIKVIDRDGVNYSNNLIGNSDYVTHILNLELPLEELFTSFHDTSVRQRIRKGEKKNFDVELGENEEDLMQFYQLHTVVRKKHGLPPHPYTFFANLWRHLSPQNMVFMPLVKSDKQTVSAAFILKFKNTFYFEHSATASKYLKDCANQVMIWESIKFAHKAGADYFDFGRSALNNCSLIDFKERWNAKALPLTSYYYPRGPSHNSSKSTRRQIISRINHHLPSSVLQLEGRLIYPHLG